MTDAREGRLAPDFSLPDHRGGTFALREVMGSSPVVLFFYPSDKTPLCAAEVCAFRDGIEQFKRVPATVAGVSQDPPEVHARFAEKKDIPFPLLSDIDGRVRKLYGATYLWLFAARVTFVIDGQGVIQLRYESNFNAAVHMQEALRVVNRLHDEARPRDGATTGE